MKKSVAPELEPILKKMCEMVGVPYEKMDFKKERWFHEHSWTSEQQAEFKTWLTKYMFDNQDARVALSYCRKDMTSCQKFADMFVFNYGWRTKRDGQADESSVRGLRPAPDGV